MRKYAITYYDHQFQELSEKAVAQFTKNEFGFSMNPILDRSKKGG